MVKSKFLFEFKYFYSNSNIIMLFSDFLFEFKHFYIQTRKAIGFKSLELNCSDITHVNMKMRNVNYYQYFYAPTTDIFLGNLQIFQKQPQEVFYEKAVLKNFEILTGKLQAYNFIKNTLQNKRFPLNIVKFLRTPISRNICSLSSYFCIDFLLCSENLLTGYKQLSY